MLFRSKGGAGSWFFHRFLRCNGIETYGKLDTDIYLDFHYIWIECEDRNEKKIIPRCINLVKHSYTRIFELDQKDKKGCSYLILKKDCFLNDEKINHIFDFYDDIEQSLSQEWEEDIIKENYFKCLAILADLSPVIENDDDDDDDDDDDEFLSCNDDDE
mgnify:CR=1 FL=1